MQKEYRIYEAGKCPVCESEDLTYGSSEIDNGHIYYEYTCESCKNDGQEWYLLDFVETVSYVNEEE